MRILEKDTRFDVLMLVKIRRGGYALPRFFSVGLTGAVTLFLPQTLLFAAALIFGGEVTDAGECLLGISLSLPFGFAYSTLAYALSFYNDKRYIPLLAPQVLYMLCVYAFPILRLTGFYPPLGVSPWIYGEPVYSDLLFVTAVIALAAAVMTFAGTFARRERR
jgi:hypothetical protein